MQMLLLPLIKACAWNLLLVQDKNDAGPLRVPEATSKMRVPQLALAHAGAAEALAPARQHVLVVDIVRDAALERGDDRARRPVDTLAQLAAFRIGRRVRRQQHPVAELAQRR